MPTPQRTRRFLTIAAAAILIMAAAAAIWRGQTAPPRKPRPIPRGDYRYAREYAEHRIRRLMAQRHLPSVAAAMIDDQDVIWQQAFGMADLEKMIPATPATVYRMWSVAKAVNAIEVMRLVEEGLLDLDTPIADYLPGFAIQSRFAGSPPITARSILSHRSGLPRNECHMLPAGPGTPETLGLLVASLQDCHAVAPVGQRYHYSNIGSNVLGHLIQEIRGQPYVFYMQDHLLAPIGMESSAFLSTELPPQAQVAPGYLHRKGEYHPIPQNDIAPLASGNLYATLKDMSALAHFILAGGQARGEQILSPETLQLVFEGQYAGSSDPQPMGLGWKLAHLPGDERVVWHDGGPDGGTGSLVALLPDSKLGVVLMSNATSFGGNVSLPLAVDLLAMMLETKTGTLPPPDAPPEPLDVDLAALEGYAGRYIVFGEPVDVSARRNKLRLSVRGVGLALAPASEETFRIDSWLLGLAGLFPLPMDPAEIEISFRELEPGAGLAMVLDLDGYAYEICPRYPLVEEPPTLWGELESAYDLFGRLPLGRATSQVIGRDEICVEKGVLTMPGVIGPLLPVSPTEIVIQSGPFAGETITYDPHTKELRHQWVVYQPR